MKRLDLPRPSSQSLGDGGDLEIAWNTNEVWPGFPTNSSFAELTSADQLFQSQETAAMQPPSVDPAPPWRRESGGSRFGFSE
jgi:hypothetical protein